VRKPSAGPNAGDSTQCDEFPFKSTLEGGEGAWIRCVTNWQNALQGSYINSWYSDNGVGKDDQFIVRVTGLDCSTVKKDALQSCHDVAVQPRDALLASGAETKTRPTLDNRTRVVVAPLDDMDAGGFHATARVASGRLKNLALLGGDGEELVPLENLDSIYSEAGLVLSWEADDYVGGVALMGEPESTTVNLTWELAAGTQAGSSNDGTGVVASGIGLVVSTAAIILALCLL
jgi:hypothetical protein